ncbi:TniQ family protein [Colwellia sp. RE-S-Sl-9]
MLKVQEDESIHSIIYRTHIINGVSDFSNIITTKGGWASFPKILNNTIHLYKPIEDSIILNLLRDIGLAKITDKTFDEPVAYRDDLERFFGKNKDKKRNSTSSSSIKYCPKCIKKHIQDFGYGIINVTWSHNSFCPIHKTDLYIAKPTNRNEAIVALGYIYRGVHPKVYEGPRYRSEYFHDFRKYKHEKKCDYIAPCLTDDLKEFIKANWKNFPKGLLDKNYASESYLTEPYMMNQIYESAKKSKYKKFRDFWNNFAEIKHIYTGVINRKTITEEIYKSTKVDCQNCKHLRCFSNLAIIPTRSDERLTKRCEVNRWILLDYLEKMGISNYSKRQKIINKMSLKQKMKALSDFKGKDFYRKYKVALEHAKFAYAEPYLRWPKDD